MMTQEPLPPLDGSAHGISSNLCNSPGRWVFTGPFHRKKKKAGAQRDEATFLLAT